jgi:hypothetical protein
MGDLVRFDHGLEKRPHVLGFGEDLPYVSEGVECTLCGKSGYHDVIVLPREETLQIVQRTEKA